MQLKFADHNLIWTDVWPTVKESINSRGRNTMSELRKGHCKVPVDPELRKLYEAQLDKPSTSGTTTSQIQIIPRRSISHDPHLKQTQTETEQLNPREQHNPREQPNPREQKKPAPLSIQTKPTQEVVASSSDHNQVPAQEKTGPRMAIRTKGPPKSPASELPPKTVRSRRTTTVK